MNKFAEPRGALGETRFPTGAVIEVTSGQHSGDHGVVVDKAPDLRPGTVWVDLETAGLRLVPGHRLARRDNHRPAS